MRERREGSRTVVDQDAYSAAIVPPSAEDMARVRLLLERPTEASGAIYLSHRQRATVLDISVDGVHGTMTARFRSEGAESDD